MVTALDRATTIRPDDPNAWTTRSIALNELNRFDDALTDNNKALALAPNHFDALVSRSWIFYRGRRLDDSMASIRKALALRPDHPLALSNEGVVLHEMKRTEEAILVYDRAITIEPDHAESRLGRAYSLLLLGRLNEGWRDHEYRWQAWRTEAKRPAGVTAREWAGEDLNGRDVLVYTEQGLGDTIQFSRYLPLMQARGARITFLAPAILHRLLAPTLPGITLFGDPADVGPQDFRTPTLSLPFHFCTDISTIPHDVPYIFAEPALIEKWRARIGSHGLRVGIAWQGNPVGSVDVGRSIPLTMFAALAGVPGLRLISLQKGFGAEQLASLPEGMIVETLGDDFDAGPDAFVDTAAVMQSLDLVITSDTSIVHVAGALARPIWVALKYVPDWRWLLDRPDSPWYPTMRLFRQSTAGDWDGVFQEIRLALEEETR